MRTFILISSVLVLSCFALVELGLAYPVAWWLYALALAAISLSLLRRTPLRNQWSPVVALISIIAAAALLYFVNWTTRKPFLRDLYRINPGMTEQEVRRIMHSYMEGSGWPALPGASSTNGPGTLNIAGSPSQFTTETAPSGEMKIKNSLVFRHSNDGAFNSDWGIVTFTNGRVAKVEFSAD